jgi:hypothetical protein
MTENMSICLYLSMLPPSDMKKTGPALPPALTRLSMLEFKTVFDKYLTISILTQDVLIIVARHILLQNLNHTQL